jgi:hypothetical protein
MVAAKIFSRKAITENGDQGLGIVNAPGKEKGRLGAPEAVLKTLPVRRAT